MNVTNPEIINLSLVTTYDVDFANITKSLIITGTNASVNVIGTTGVANEYTLVDILFLGSVTGAGSLQIFGQAIPSEILGVAFNAKAIYQNAAWTVYVTGNLTTPFISNANVVNDAAIATTKLANLTASRIPQINASGKIEASPTNNSFIALLGALTQAAADYNRVASTTASTADLNVIAGAQAAGITPAILAFLNGLTSNAQAQLNAKANIADFSGLIEIRSFSVTIPSSEVLTMNATPISLVLAQGAGLKIKPLAIWGEMAFAGTPYTTNGNLVVTSGGEIARVTANNFLFGTISREVNILANTAIGITAQQYVANTPLLAQIETGEALAGDSPITISGLYIVTT